MYTSASLDSNFLKKTPQKNPQTTKKPQANETEGQLFISFHGEEEQGDTQT